MDRRVRLSVIPLGLTQYPRFYLVTHAAPGFEAGVYVDYRQYGFAVRDPSRRWGGTGRIPFHPDSQSRRFDTWEDLIRHWLETFGVSAPRPPLRLY